MKISCLKNITRYIVLFLVPAIASSQECIKDSNFYSITYRGLDKNHVTSAAVTSRNEIIALSRHSVFSDFLTKFTSQGAVIWSNEYIPNYPLDYWWQSPWYANTLIEGMEIGKDSSFFVYGSTTEHGTTLNGAGPPEHLAGFILHLDKFGNILSGRYVGNWLTDYSVNSLIELPDGSLVMYLRSHSYPYISKVMWIDPAGEITIGTPLQPFNWYTEVGTSKAVMKQLSNGNIIVGNIMLRTLDDTLQYPFQPPIIVPAPLYYFHFFSIDGRTGKLLEEWSYQCPPLKNTNAPADFIPEIKNVTELPGGKVSFLVDMYVPQDDIIFYKQRVYLRSVVNLITNMDGGLLRHIAYNSHNGPLILQNAQPTGNNGEQIALAVDSTSQQLVLFNIGADNQVGWSKSYVNILGAPGLTGIAMQKQNNKGYFIFQSDPDFINFQLSITNANGKNPCTELPDFGITQEEFPWPWYSGKIHFNVVPINIDFRYSPFNFLKRAHPLTAQTDCEYQVTCCKDFIDSLHPHNISICENEVYTLPDNTLVKDSGNYYITLKTRAGCDSIEFYNVRVVKSPAHLTTSPDTCLHGAALIELRASPGYDTYWWNGYASDKPFYQVHAPGNYTVKVENKCGSKTDTIRVYDGCEFPIYFPNAFTPNGDLLNDILNVPELNKNKLRRLTIYNRWGEIVFSTTNPHGGWNGTVKGIPQPTAVYVYYLEMESLSGQRLNQKGTIVLIR